MPEPIVDLRNTRKEEQSPSTRLQTPSASFGGQASSGSTEDATSDVFKSWIAPEFQRHSESGGAGLLFGLVALGVIIWGIFSKNILLAFIGVLSGFLLLVWSLKEPREMEFAITKMGVRIGKRLYLFEELKSFWIFYEPPDFKELSIRSKKLILPELRLPLGEENPTEIRRILTRFLPEQEHHDSLVDVFMRRIGF